MDNGNEKEQLDAVSEPQEEGYVPRPAWQVWMARVGLVLFLLFVLWQLMQIAGGGLL
ncbi:MAG: hypothetical protein IJD98_05605 [Oscillospiraceae bacterium]|nr:hypothetical protein [Oscillospiraceae bacterium]